MYLLLLPNKIPFVMDAIYFEISITISLIALKNEPRRGPFSPDSLWVCRHLYSLLSRIKFTHWLTPLTRLIRSANGELTQINGTDLNLRVFDFDELLFCKWMRNHFYYKLNVTIKSHVHNIKLFTYFLKSLFKHILTRTSR